MLNYHLVVNSQQSPEERRCKYGILRFYLTREDSMKYRDWNWIYLPGIITNIIGTDRYEEVKEIIKNGYEGFKEDHQRHERERQAYRRSYRTTSS